MCPTAHDVHCFGICGCVHVCKSLFPLPSSLSGRFSRVRLGKLKLSGATHALKVLSSDVPPENYQRELCIGCHLKHRNLVAYSGGIEGKGRVIAMEQLVSLSLTNINTLLSYWDREGGIHPSLK